MTMESHGVKNDILWFIIINIMTYLIAKTPYEDQN